VFAEIQRVQDMTAAALFEDMAAERAELLAREGRLELLSEMALADCGPQAPWITAFPNVICLRFRTPRYPWIVRRTDRGGEEFA